MSAHDAAATIARLGVTPRFITADSRAVETGYAFAAFRGSRADGRDHIDDAIARGASAVLWDDERFAWKTQWQVANAPVAQLRARLGELAAFIFGNPSEAMWVTGVTGTNGKTTCAHWIASALDSPAQRAAVIGTLGNGFAGALAASPHTTPDAAALQATLAALRDAGAASVTMEVSSHGLDQGRVNGVAFDVALFTNLTRDHLDYHGTMAAYGSAKARLFAWPGLHASVINIDDAFGQRLAEDVKSRGARVLTYGGVGGDVRATSVAMNNDGVTLDVDTPWGRGSTHVGVIGDFNVHNLLGTLGVLLVSDMKLADALRAIAALTPPPGRMQRFGGNGKPTVVVDYAHTPDALEKALAALRPIVVEGGALFCVFGCGGERDPGKRPQMGAIAARLADRVVITSDNPRSEDPQAIANAISRGVLEAGNRRWTLELDRARAIRAAIAAADVGDVVLVAGKGHETYQDAGGVRAPFVDADVARDALLSR
ncbi:MAG TPA: UDP-N-acetylmuramoyl-L-alanyl-D-glutamate--2,6-diaminopimelate ligase [Casimicrobiaceae bacterium]